MKRKSSFNYLARIEKIQHWLGENPGVHINEMISEFSDTPRGTLTSLISLMLATNHVIRGAKGFYTLPVVVANARSIAYDIDRLKKTPQLFRKNRTMSQNDSKSPEPIIETPIVAITDHVMQALALLKSCGYKVTIEI